MFSLLLCSEYWYSIIQNAIGCTIGSLLAILFSFLIYFKTIKKNKQENENEKNIEERRQLKAFSLMLKNALDMLEKQQNSLNIFISKIKNQLNEFPLPIIYSLGELKRINENITIEKTGLAYINYFKNNDSIKEFTDIQKIVDYLFIEFYNLQDIIRFASQNHLDRKMRVSNDLDACIKLVNDFKISDPTNPCANKIFHAKHQFDIQRDQLNDLKPVYTLFFFPIRNMTLDFINENFQNRFINDLLFHTSKGIEHYEDIEIGYKKFENELEEILKNSLNQIIRLKKISRSLLEKDELSI